MTQDLYLSTKASLLNWISKLNSSKLFDFDSTSEEEELEQVDLIGPMEFYMDANNTLASVGVKIVACTFSDPQIQKLNVIINDIMNGSQGKKVRIPILHYTTGNPIGFMVSDGSVLTAPVVRLKSRTRPFQTVAINFKLTLTL